MPALPFADNSFDRSYNAGHNRALILPDQLETMLVEVRRVPKALTATQLSTHLPNRWVYDVTFPFPKSSLIKNSRRNPRSESEKKHSH